MTDEILDLIDEIIRMRRQIKEEIQELQKRMAAARIEKKSRFGFALQVRFDPVKSTFAGENFKMQAEVYSDVVAWGRANAIRSKTYGADIAAIGDAEVEKKYPMLLKIKDACDNELSSDIPMLRDLIISLEDLSRSYSEIIRR